MAKPAKTLKLKPAEKILNLLITGDVFTKDQINDRLGTEIEMYRISTYMWYIKTEVGGIIRVTKDGRRVVGYQLVNVKDIEKYLKDRGILLNVKPPVEKLSDLKAEKVSDTEVLEVTEIAE